jgi:hypothetical protein
MQHLISGIPEPFKTQIAGTGNQPLEDAPIHYWAMVRNGVTAEDIQGELWGHALADALLGPAFTPDGNIIFPESPIRHSRIILYKKTYFNLDWDGQQLTCTLTPFPGSEGEHLKCGWDAVLTATPVLDQRLVDMLGVGTQWRGHKPYLQRVMQQPLELVALSIVDYQYALETDNQADPDWSVEFEKYMPLVEGMAKGERETVIALMPEWKGSAEALAQAARKL